MSHSSLPPGAHGFFSPHSVWWVPDTFFHFGHPGRKPKPYRRPAYCLGILGPLAPHVPASRHDPGAPLKEAMLKSPWTVRVPAGTLGDLEGDSLLMVQFQQSIPVREATFAGPRFIAMAPESLRHQMRDKLEGYIDACLS